MRKFKVLFCCSKHFVEAMDTMRANTMITDQAISMENAIEKVFPLEEHRLCTWHILKNSKNIGHLKVLGGLLISLTVFCEI